MKKNEIKTREQWLERAVELMSPLFAQHGYKVPEVRVSCGWPSAKGTATKNRTIGQCWSTRAAKDKVSQIFISPFLEDIATEQGVLSTLVHEVVHAVVGVEEGHNKVFGKCARALGLAGKLTSTTAGPELLAACKAWAMQLGTYPHSQLNSLKSPVKKQTTRLVKAECECGYNVRVTRKWLDEIGAPICPHNKKAMKYEIPEQLEPDDDGGDE